MKCRVVLLELNTCAQDDDKMTFIILVLVYWEFNAKDFDYKSIDT